MRYQQWQHDHYVISNMIGQFLMVGKTKSAVKQNVQGLNSELNALEQLHFETREDC